MLKSNEYADSIGQIEAGIYRSSGAIKQPNSAAFMSENVTTTRSGLDDFAKEPIGGQSNTSESNTEMILEALNRNTSVMQQLQANGVQGVWEHDRFENGIRQVEEASGRHILSSNNNRIIGEPIT